MPLRSLTWPSSTIAILVTGALFAMAACSGNPLRVGPRDAGAKGGPGGMNLGGGTGGTAGVSGAGGATGVSDGGVDLPAAVGGRDGSGPGDAAVRLDQAPDISAAARAEQVCRDAIVAQCERLYACQGFSPGDCAQFAADRCPEYYFGPHTLRTVDSVEACVPLIRLASCTDFLMGNATECLLGGLGTAGDPCSGPSECASNSCSALFPRCGTCAAPLALGKSCDVSTGHCASGTACHKATRVCVPTPLVVAHAAEGEPCDTAGDPLVGCEGDLMCVPTKSGGTAGKCAPLPKQGEHCLTANSLPQCAPGLHCGLSRVGGVRAYLCGDPTPCGAAFCDANSFCYENPTVPISCRPFVGIGEACSRAADSDRNCGAGGYCAVTSVSNDGGPVSDGTCIQFGQVELGEACDTTTSCRAPLVCQAGSCTRFDPATCYQPTDAGSGGAGEGT